jgi:hypothetical protein
MYCEVKIMGEETIRVYFKVLHRRSPENPQDRQKILSQDDRYTEPNKIRKDTSRIREKYVCLCGTVGCGTLCDVRRGNLLPVREDEAGRTGWKFKRITSRLLRH